LSASHGTRARPERHAVDVAIAAGDIFRYSTIWQRRNLVLVTLGDAAGDGTYPSDLIARDADFRELDSACVMTRDRVAGVPVAAALVADRWGEVVYISAAPHVGSLPTPSELFEWLDCVERQCPECEGEAR
jgi:hypothetical protein